MPSVSSEIISDITNHIRECGDDFICREAYTPASARSVRLHFVKDCGSAQRQL